MIAPMDLPPKVEATNFQDATRIETYRLVHFPRVERTKSKTTARLYCHRHESKEPIGSNLEWHCLSIAILRRGVRALLLAVASSQREKPNYPKRRRHHHLAAVPPESHRFDLDDSPLPLEICSVVRTEIG
jgi:hypothetical protein